MRGQDALRACRPSRLELKGYALEIHHRRAWLGQRLDRQFGRTFFERELANGQLTPLAVDVLRVPRLVAVWQLNGPRLERRDDQLARCIAECDLGPGSRVGR